MSQKRARRVLVVPALLGVSLLVALVSCGPPARFESRVAYEPLAAELKAQGWDPSQVIVIRAMADLTRLVSGTRYKFVEASARAIAVSPLPADAAHNGYVHPILAGGHAVMTAGGIVVDHAAGVIARVSLDQDSKAYCPTFQSLDEAAHALERLGVGAARIVRVDRPATCASPRH